MPCPVKGALTAGRHRALCLFRPSRRAGRYMAVAQLWALSGLFTPGLAWDPVSALGRADWVWGTEEALELGGTAVRWQRFQTRLAPVEAAQRLQDVGGQRFSRMQWTGAEISLSGLAQGRHWLAWVSPLAQGAQGLVSRIHPGATEPPVFDATAFLPSDAERVFYGRSRADREAGVLAIYRSIEMTRDVWRHVSRRLALPIWRALDSSNPQDGPPGLHRGVWRHTSGRLLSVWVAPRRNHSIVTFWYRRENAS